MTNPLELAVHLRSIWIIYTLFNVYVRGFGAHTPVNQTYWVTKATPTHRPKSDSNRCVVDLFDCTFFIFHW